MGLNGTPSAVPASANGRLEKWRHWIRRITEDVRDAYMLRDFFLGTVGIAESNPLIDATSLWFAFFERVYVDSVVMAVRRQIKDKPGDRSVSMARLLRELAESPEEITRAEFGALYRRGNRFDFMGAEQAEKDFADFAEAVAEHVDPARVLSDLRSLRSLAATVVDYSDTHIAHLDGREPAHALTKGLIFDAVDELGRLVQKYSVLLSGTWAELHTVAHPVWHVFEQPWLPPGWRSRGRAPWLGDRGKD